MSQLNHTAEHDRMIIQAYTHDRMILHTMHVHQKDAQSRMLRSLLHTLAISAAIKRNSIGTLQGAAGPTPQSKRERDGQNKREQSSQFGLTPH